MDIKSKNILKKAINLSLVAVLTTGLTAGLFSSQANAASFTTMSIRPSRIQTAQTAVNFLVKVTPASVGVESSLTVTFGGVGSYAVNATPANVTVSTTGIASWDATCTNALPGIGTAATAVSGQTATFASSDLTVATPYCFIVTGGITNPAAAGNNAITVATKVAAVTLDTSTMVLPTIANDTVVITAAVAPFVRCNVTTTTGADNASDLGTLQYGTITNSTDDIQIQGGTNAPAGMTWFYRTNGVNNGLYSTLQTSLLSGSTAETAISPTTALCSGAAPCFGIYYSGTTTSGTGSFVGDANFTGGTISTTVGPMTTSIFGNALGTSNSLPASQVTANYKINATAAEASPAADDYSATLIFTCKADL